MSFTRVFLVAAALVLPSLASAQWQWVDRNGSRVFSDQPPPADIPDKNILRQPGTRATAAAVPASAPASAAAAPARPASAPHISGKDKELQEKRKLVDAAEAGKKKAEEERVAKVRAENCQRAKGAKATLDSGIRIAQTNAKGEREIMDDKARAAEARRIDALIASECTAS